MIGSTWRLKPGVTADDVRSALRQQFEKHAATLVAFYGLLWAASQNPLFAWAALSYLTASNSPQIVLPPWLRDYLRQASANLVQTTRHRPPEEVPPLVPQALEFSRQGANTVSDAHKLFYALQLYSDYVIHKETAPVRARAKWAIKQIKREHRLQSDEAVERRVREGKRLVLHIQKLGGRPYNLKAVEQAAKKFHLIRLIQEKLDAVAPLPIETSESLRTMFKGSPNRRKRG